MSGDFEVFHADRPIGGGTTTLDMLKNNYPWLAERLELMERDSVQRELHLAELKQQNVRLRQRCQEQKRELRRLNQSIVDKLHQLQVSRDEARCLAGGNNSLAADNDELQAKLAEATSLLATAATVLEAVADAGIRATCRRRRRFI